MDNVKRVSDFLDETKCYFLATTDGNKPSLEKLEEAKNIVKNYVRLYVRREVYGD